MKEKTKLMEIPSQAILMNLAPMHS